MYLLIKQVDDLTIVLKRHKVLKESSMLRDIDSSHSFFATIRFMERVVAGKVQTVRRSARDAVRRTKELIISRQILMRMG